MLHHRYDNIRIEDIVIYRHWHAESEKYAGGDSLATHMYLGWKLAEVVQLEEKWYAGTRRVAVYHFELTRDDETITMPVIGNPYIDQIIARSALKVVAIGEYQRPQKELEMEASL